MAGKRAIHSDNVADLGDSNIIESWCSPRKKARRALVNGESHGGDLGPVCANDRCGSAFEMHTIPAGANPSSCTVTLHGQIMLSTSEFLSSELWHAVRTFLSYKDHLQASTADSVTRRHRLPSGTLAINFPLSITDAKVRRVAPRCQGLVAINLAQCRDVTDGAVLTLLDGCCNLLRIDLAGCLKVTDTGLRGLAHKCCQLSFLNLWGCGGVTDEGVKAVAHGCKHLSTINLGCTKVTDSALLELAVHCRALTCLKLWGSWSSIDNHWRHLAASRANPDITGDELRQWFDEIEQVA